MKELSYSPAQILRHIRETGISSQDYQYAENSLNVLIKRTNPNYADRPLLGAYIDLKKKLPRTGPWEMRLRIAKRKMMDDGRSLRMEDNSPVHTSRVDKQWRVEHLMRILNHPRPSRPWPYRLFLELYQTQDRVVYKQLRHDWKALRDVLEYACPKTSYRSSHALRHKLHEEI